jgi:hypothetical protein
MNIDKKLSQEGAHETASTVDLFKSKNTGDLMYKSQYGIPVPIADQEFVKKSIQTAVDNLKDGFVLDFKNKYGSVLAEKGLLKNAEIVLDKVTLKVQDLEERVERGGERVSGWKISPMFWVRVEDVTVNEKNISFSLKSVRQNIADITAKINLKTINYSEIEKYYLDKI